MESDSTADTPRFLTTGDVAEALDVQRSTVRKWARRGQIGAVKAGGGWRIRRDEVYDADGQLRRKIAEPAA